MNYFSWNRENDKYYNQNIRALSIFIIHSTTRVVASPHRGNLYVWSIFFLFLTHLVKYSFCLRYAAVEDPPREFCFHNTCKSKVLHH